MAVIIFHSAVLLLEDTDELELNELELEVELELLELVELDELKLLELLELLELELELEKLELNDELDDELVELELLELSELELLDTELEEDELLDEFSNISKFCVYPVTTSAPSVALSLEARTYKYLLSSVSQGTEKE